MRATFTIAKLFEGVHSSLQLGHENIQNNWYFVVDYRKNIKLFSFSQGFVLKKTHFLQVVMGKKYVFIKINFRIQKKHLQTMPSSHLVWINLFFFDQIFLHFIKFN